MRHPVLGRFVLALLLLTFVGGPWLSAAAEAAPKPCTMMMSGDNASGVGPMKMGDTDKPMPCHDSTPACMKRICCLVSTTLPAAPPSVALPVPSGVHYPLAASLDGGRSVKPELFPPISA